MVPLIRVVTVQFGVIRHVQASQLSVAGGGTGDAGCNLEPVSDCN